MSDLFDVAGKVVMITGASRGTNSSSLASLATGERAASAGAAPQLALAQRQITALLVEGELITSG